MSYGQICFVKARTPQNPLSEDGLTMSSARSHAASHVHRKRREQHRREEEMQVALSVPTPGLHQGNSDPFDCLPISITPIVNAAIRYRKVYWTAARFPSKPSWASTWARLATEKTSIGKDDAALQDCGSASAYALYCLSIQARVADESSPAERCEEFSLKAQSLAILRRHLQTQVADEGTLRGMIWLFKSAVTAGNVIEARAHGLMLRTFIVGKNHSVGPELLTDMDIIWHDYHLSLKSMQPTIFDSEWAAVDTAVYDTTFGQVESLTDHIDQVDGSLDDEIRQIIVRQRKLSWALTSPRAGTLFEYDMKMVAGGWVVSQIIVEGTRLINYYLHGRPMGYVALAMTCCLLRQASLRQFGRKHLFASTPTVLIRLRAEMARLAGRLGYTNAQLYCLYVGAQTEQWESSPHASELWFNHAFARTAEGLALTTWDDIREILHGFLYLPHIEPAGETWVKQTLTSYRATYCISSQAANSSVSVETIERDGEALP